jgi:hypothetical protein
VIIIADIDPAGFILAISISLMWLQVVGIPLVKGMNTKKNLIRHGYLTAFVVVLQTVIVLLGMVPSFNGNIFGMLTGLPMLFSLNIWLHVILGVIAIAAGIALVVLWKGWPSPGLRCARAKRFMLPVFCIWVAAVVTGSIIHLLGMV